MTRLFVGLEIGRQPPSGGIARFTQHLIKGVADIGPADDHSSVLIGLGLWDDMDLRSPTPGVLAIGCGRNKVLFLGRFVRHVLRRPSDLLIGHVLLIPLALLTKVLSRRTKTFLFAYGIEVWDRPSRLRAYLTRHFADYVVAISDFTATRMAEAYGIRRERFFVLPCAVDVTDDERPVRKASDHPTVVTVSRLDFDSDQKGIPCLIRAMPNVLQAAPLAELVVIGDGEATPSLRALARDLRVEQHVRFLGRVGEAELRRIYETADVFALPSVSEGFGIVYLEAWAHRLPVVAARAGAIPELISHGETGLLVDQDSAQVAHAVLTLICDSELSSRLGSAGFRTVCRRYSQDAFNRRVRILFEGADAKCAAS